MPFMIRHKGVILSSEQLEAIAPVVENRRLISMPIPEFEKACETAMVKAGCPVDLEKK